MMISTREEVPRVANENCHPIMNRNIDKIREVNMEVWENPNLCSERALDEKVLKGLRINSAQRAGNVIKMENEFKFSPAR